MNIFMKLLTYLCFELHMYQPLKFTELECHTSVCWFYPLTRHPFCSSSFYQPCFIFSITYLSSFLSLRFQTYRYMSHTQIYVIRVILWHHHVFLVNDTTSFFPVIYVSAYKAPGIILKSRGKV